VKPEGTIIKNQKGFTKSEVLKTKDRLRHTHNGGTFGRRDESPPVFYLTLDVYIVSILSGIAIFNF
jgi:hypothetical protein